MLDEKLQEQKAAIAQRWNEYQELLQELLQVEHKKEMKEEFRKSRGESREGLSTQMTVFKPKNKILEFFQKTFSRKYREAEKRNDELKFMIAETDSQIAGINDEIRELRVEQQSLRERAKTYNISELETQLAQQSDRTQAIQMLLQRHPELREDVGFMVELVEESPTYIEYDRTDEHEVYMRLCEVYEQELTGESELDGYQQGALETAKRLKGELQAPKKPEVGKYKIPHKYLFEAMRKDAVGTNKVATIILSAAGQYLELDGTLDKEYGEKIQEMYEDEDHYLLQHKVNMNARSIDEVEAIKNSVCKNGLSCSGQGYDIGKGHISQLPCTTIGNYQPEMRFLTALKPDDNVFMLIPKQAIDSKKSIPVWGADTPKVEHPQKDYVLPEYVVGYVNPETQEFVDNPVPVQERKKYPYTFYEGEIESIESQSIESQGWDR